MEYRRAAKAFSSMTTSMKRPALLFPFALLFAVLPVQAQPIAWSLPSPASALPGARYDGAIAWDSVGRQLFLFGGQNSSALNDLWSWSPATNQWTTLHPAAPLPPIRFGHTVVFDSARRRLIVFGGQAGGFHSDVWAYDIAAGTWSNLAADGAGPNSRYGHSGIYDAARDRLVISHGFTTAGRYNDTWAFDLKTNTWRDISPGGVRPLQRCLHHAAYDAKHGQMYLYGGCSSGYGPCPQGDLWAFDLAAGTWTERTPAVSPPARQHYGMAYDEARARLVLFGGSGSGLFNDTWEFDPSTSKWQQITPAGTAPSARERHEAAWAPDQGLVYFFGGSALSGNLTNELWSLGPPPRPVVFANGVVDAFAATPGATVQGAVVPGEIVSVYGRGLGPDAGLATAFDPKTQQLPTVAGGTSVLIGGVPAPLFFVQAGQLNVQVPYELAGMQKADLVVSVNNQTADPVSLPVVATHPVLYPAIWNTDGSVNSPDRPAAPGSIVILYATGQGLTSPPSRTGAAAGTQMSGGLYPEPAATTTLMIGGVAAEVLFRGQAPGTTGVMQINARIPASAVGPLAPVVLSIGGALSQAGVSVAIR